MTIRTSMQLLSQLIVEASGMTGEQFADQVRVDRGRGYIEAFKKEFPFQAALLAVFTQGTPEDLLQRLAAFDPKVLNVPQALAYLRSIHDLLS